MYEGEATLESRNNRIEEIVTRLREMRMPVMANVLMISLENGESITEETVDYLEKHSFAEITYSLPYLGPFLA